MKPHRLVIEIGGEDRGRTRQYMMLRHSTRTLTWPLAIGWTTQSAAHVHRSGGSTGRMIFLHRLFPLHFPSGKILMLDNDLPSRYTFTPSISPRPCQSLIHQHLHTLCTFRWDHRWRTCAESFWYGWPRLQIRGTVERKRPYKPPPG